MSSVCAYSNHSLCVILLELVSTNEVVETLTSSVRLLDTRNINYRKNQHMKKITLAAMSLLFTCSVPAFADDPLLKYNQLDVAYQYTNNDSVDGSVLDNGNGLNTGLMVSPVEGFFLELGYDYNDSGIKTGPDFNVQGFQYGIGGYTSLAEDLDLVGRVGGIAYKFTGDVPLDTIDTVYVGGELRWAPCRVAEFNAGLTWLRYEGNERNMVYHLGTVVPVAENVGLTGRTEIDEDEAVALIVGGRLTF
jgi:hypothetical protein